MCEYSLHAAHRKARESEQLISKDIPEHRGSGLRGLYSRDNSDGLLVCIAPNTKAVIDEVDIESRFHSAYYKQTLKTWGGKKNVEVSLTRQGHQDTITFSDGQVIYLSHLPEGTKISIGVPATKPGVDAVKAALVEQEKTAPTPVVEVTNAAGRLLSQTREAIRSRMRRAKAKAMAE